MAVPIPTFGILENNSPKGLKAISLSTPGTSLFNGLKLPLPKKEPTGLLDSNGTPKLAIAAAAAILPIGDLTTFLTTRLAFLTILPKP